MDEKEPRVDRCIEHRYLTGRCRFLSVEEYEENLARARSLSSPRARSFHEVAWAEGAPNVEQLTRHWQRTDHADDFRITDWDEYDRQMRELLGIT